MQLEKIIASGTKLTPMMQQYYDIKKQFSETLLMFRMGDFYEVFFEDAQNAAKILNISLTHRGKLGEYKIPMAGIPHHAAATYIDRITAHGLKVAICEQVEDPKAAKGIVKRAVTQVVSPGMPYDLDKSAPKEQQYMSCAYQEADNFYIVFIDYTTGDFFGMKLNSLEEMAEKIQLYKPKELISYMGQWEDSELMSTIENSLLVTHLSLDHFNEKYNDIYIEKLIPSYKRDEVIKAHPLLLKPISAMSFYICSTQAVESLTHIRPFGLISFDNELKITHPTLVGLEIFPKAKEVYAQSLLGFMDSTQTSMGARALKKLFQKPTRNIEAINKRQSTLQFFIDHMDLTQSIRTSLSEIRDIERILAKVSTGKVNGQDCLNLAKAYQHFKEILPQIKIDKSLLPKLSTKDHKILEDSCEQIIKIINDDIGATLEKGNLINSGFHQERDKLSKLANNSIDALIELEQKYRQETGINNLKVKSNNVAGFFIEVSKSHTSKVPASFVRRQTLVNSERYQTQELADFEKQMIVAKEKLLKLEREIFQNLVQLISDHSSLWLDLASSIALIDCYQSLAWVSFQNEFTKPKLSKKKQVFEVQSAWHPLIKKAIKDQFICHDLSLNQECYFGLITGPNMAGKTTVMREMAIIQFLAQVGSFVPANSCHLSTCDYLFSRLGAHDDIIKGQSTFMVEMSETAEIIRHASSDSMIILDEIGRGTSTYDGLSIAWSLVEYFVKKTKAITLFSTHYHELIELVDSLVGAKNLTVKTINKNGRVEFRYELIEKGAAQSFGIHVAKLAGLPKEILNRSEAILKKLEKNHNHASDVIGKYLNEQLDMFSAQEEPKEEEVLLTPVLAELEQLDLTQMTPIQALNKLYDMQQDQLKQ